MSPTSLKKDCERGRKVAKELAEKSGNSFQCKVANYFRANNWAVLLSPYYVDASSDKSRESDLIVEKFFPVTNYFPGAPGSVGTVSSECAKALNVTYVTEFVGNKM
jgi:hypothetical protein